MKAIRAHEFGSPDVLILEDIAVPQPAKDELLIKIYASSVNPVDWKIIKGARKDKFPVSLPLIPGWDVSGIVAQTGSHVQGFKAGDEVYSRPDPTRDGAFAEYIVVKADQVALKPTSLSHTDAAAVPLAGLTAWQGLFQYGGLEKGQKVLIHGASGGVGTFAVQFAQWKGAYVIGTASKANTDFLRHLGADKVIDYKNKKFEDELNDIDLVFDTIGGDTQRRSLAVLKNGGKLITTLKPEFREEASAKNIHLEGFTAQSYPNDLNKIAELIDNGHVKPVVTKIMPLEQAPEAEKLNASGHTRGKIVLKVA